MEIPREKGQGLVEYALIMVLVVVVVILIVTILGQSVLSLYSNIIEQF
jgi:pilus assembly protein Flp/PilA